ncbi:MAG TPA: hypothetical protein VGD90_12315, partial [Sphingobacteriaceae bacterium]
MCNLYHESGINYSNSCEAVHWHKNQDRPAQFHANNIMISSCLDTLEADIRTRGLSIKYVARGRELYHLSKRDFNLTQGKYLLVNNNAPVLETRINTANTWGMCVDIEPGLVKDVLQQIVTPDLIDPVADLPKYFLTDELFVQENIAGPQLAGILEAMIKKISSHSGPEEPRELLFDLTAQIIRESMPTIGFYYRLKASRLSTRKELYRRILLGREVLE